MIRYTVVSMLSWVFLVWQSPLFGQDTLFIHALSQVEDGQLKIRWAPSHALLWKYANQVGYEVERVTLKDQQGKLLTPKQRLASARKWAAIKPHPPETWERMADTSEVAGMGAAAIYGEGIEIQGLSENPILQTYEQHQSSETSFGFGLLAADQDWQVATAMGLALADDQIIAQQTYLYSIYPAQRPTSFFVAPAHLMITASSPTALPTPTGLKADFGDKVVHLEWDAAATPSYSGYWLEKSLDNGQQFVPVNTLPIIPSAQSDQNQLLAFTRDSLLENFQEVVYRIRGKTVFGQLSPPSDTVVGFGKPARLQAALGITRIEETEKQKLKITWDFPSSFNQHLEGFEIYRAKKKQGPYLRLPTDKLKAITRSFVDTAPYKTAYYQVVAKDIYGHTYSSFSRLGQLEDSTPPNPPTNLSGTLDKDGQVTLSWSPSTADDLMGYRVFRSNQKDGYYNQVTSYFTRDTFYSHQVDINTTTRSIYYKVISLDYRENYSDKSDFCEIGRPDLLPPIPPAMRRALPQEGSIVLSWKSSTSQDLASHEIQRKKITEEAWKTIFSWLPPTEHHHYIDSTVQRQQEYEYRVVARDQANLESASKVVRVSSLDKGNRSAIENFQVSLPSPATNVQLQWKYPPDPSLHQFVIFRSKEDGPLRTIAILRLDQIAEAEQPATSAFQVYEYQDKKVQNQKTYQYQVIAKHKDGGQSPLSPIRPIRVE